MHLRPKKICLLVFLFLGAGFAARPALADPRVNPGSAIPNPGSAPPQKVENEIFKNPEIMEPQEPDYDCNPTDPNSKKTPAEKGTRLGKKCITQGDAFVRAAEAASYLAHYQQNYSNFGDLMRNPETQKEFQNALQDCIKNTNCDQEKRTMLLQLVTQYGFARDLRSKMLENQDRARRMHSIEQTMTATDWSLLQAAPTRILNSKPGRSGSRPAFSSSLRKNTFRLKPADMQALDFSKISMMERDRIGTEFNREVRGFVDSYTRSAGKSRWYYVPIKISAVGAARYVPAVDPKNRDPITESRLIDSKKMAEDIQIQESPAVRSIVEGYQQKYQDVVAEKKRDLIVKNEKGEIVQKSVDTLDAAVSTLGFGQSQSRLDMIGKPDGPSSPAEVAAGVVVQMNKDIYEAEHKKSSSGLKDQESDFRFPSGSQDNLKPGNTIHSVMVDVQAFDKFLDSIWPTSTTKK